MTTRPGTPEQSVTPAAHRFELALRLAVLVTCGFAFSLQRTEPDLWGHVQYGRDAWASGLPRTTSYSFTAEGHRWINHENLSELLFAWCVDRWGVSSLLMGKCLLGMLIVASLLWYASRRGVTTWVASAAVLLVSINLTGFWQTRPQVLSYFLFAVLLGLTSFSFGGWQDRWHFPQLTPWGSGRFARPTSAGATWNPRRLRCLWAAPVVILVWVNTHGAFLAGLCIFTAYIGLRALELWADGGTAGRAGRAPHRCAMQLAGVVVASWCVTLVTPYGPELHGWLLNALTIPRPEITEWHPLRPGDEPFWPFVALLAAVVAGLAFSRRGLDATQLIILALVLWQAGSHQRHIPFFVLLTGFWMPIHWQSACARWQARTNAQPLSPRSLRWAGGLLLLIGGGLSAALAARWRELPVRHDDYPVAAVAYMSQQELCGNLVVTYNWAQYAIAALGADAGRKGQPPGGGIRVGFDGRFRTCYPLELVDQHFDFILGWDPGIPRCRAPQSPPPRADAVLHRGDPHLVLISRKQPHAVRVMQAQAEWILLYQDQLAQLWGRRTTYDNPRAASYVPPEDRQITETPQVGSTPWPALPERSGSRQGGATRMAGA